MDTLRMRRRHIASGVVIAVALLAAVSGQAALVGHWDFNDGTANDLSGNGNNGTLLGTAMIVPDPIRGNNVLSLTNADTDNDGDGKVDLGSPDALNLTGQISIAAWIKPDPLLAPPAGLALRNIVNRGHGTGPGLPNREFTFRIDATRTAENPNVTNYDFGQWQTGIGDQHATTAIPEEDLAGNWVHLAGTGTQQGADFVWRLYRNGVLINESAPFTDAVRDMTGVGWAIGGRGGLAATTFERGYLGLIDDVRIYDHPLSQAEIEAIMTGGPPPVAGDTNGDGIGGEFPDDFTPIQMNFRKMVTMRSEGDLVSNGRVDFADYQQWKAAHVGMGGSLAGVDLGFLTNVPEPTTLGLLLIALSNLAAARRRR